MDNYQQTKDKYYLPQNNQAISSYYWKVVLNMEEERSIIGRSQIYNIQRFLVSGGKEC